MLSGRGGLIRVVDVPAFLLSQQNYVLAYDEYDNPYVTFDTSQNTSFTASTNYTPPNGQPTIELTLGSDGVASPTYIGPPTFQELYLTLNLQTQCYQVCGSNLDPADAYDYQMQTYDIMNRNARFYWNRVGLTSNYILTPNALTTIPVSPASK
jgi:hypothetical protein